MESHHPAKLGGQGNWGNENLMLLICHVILQDRVAQEPCDLLGRRVLKQVTTMPSLVVRGSMVVET